MKEELENKIFEQCPIIFRDKDDTLMRWGFTCDDGWYQIIKDVSLAIEAQAQELKSQGVKEKKLPHVDQIKQKFGTLRYYMSNSTENVNKLVEEAEQKALVTCEICSKAGTRRTLKNYWVLVACDSCAAALDENDEDS